MLVFVVYWQCKVILVSLGSAQCDGLLSFFFVFSCTHHLCLRVHGDNEMRLQLMCHVPLECNPSYKSNSWECERYLIKEIVLEVRTIGTLFTYGFFYFFFTRREGFDFHVQPLLRICLSYFVPKPKDIFHFRHPCWFPASEPRSQNRSNGFTTNFVRAGFSSGTQRPHHLSRNCCLSSLPTRQI